MATYPGMSLNGEVRESVSLDEDDLSDVEDEVFIRDGKSGYKLAEDIGLKRPLMAPRRKLGRNDLSSRLKARPPCKALCKPCCYIIGALTVLIGLIIIVVILVSMFPLPIDKIKHWIMSKTTNNITKELLPCSDIKVTNVWTKTFPKFTSESPIRALDVNNDKIDDFILGFGTGVDNSLHPDVFCPIFIGVSPPCEGGVMAINGINGDILWRKFLPHSIYGLICSYDVNDDNIADCLVNGKGGIFSMINALDGSVIWDFKDKKPENVVMDIFLTTFIPDQDNDKIPDILASHTLQNGRNRLGYLLIVSGKTGTLLARVPTPNNTESYYNPQYINEDTVIFGTGSPSSSGSLYRTSIYNITSGNLTATVIYEDKFKGILTTSVLVDITGDGISDIISAMFNTTIVAIDGKSMEQLWNFTINNSETVGPPIPGYFNNDNITDFFVKYQTGLDFPTYFYSQSYVLDGKTGKPINHNPIIDNVGYQMGGLTLQMQNYGLDMYLYWILDCKGYEGMQDMFEYKSGTTIKQQSNADMCKLRFNTTTTAKLYALNQFDQPPGIKIYDSDENLLIEYNNTQNPLNEARDYMKIHPSLLIADAADNGNILDVLDRSNPETFHAIKYKDGSSFRNKAGNHGLIRDFGRSDNRKKADNMENQKYEDYDQAWNQEKPPTFGETILNEDADNDYNNYFDTNDRTNIYNENNQFLLNNKQKMMNRDPRSKYDSNTSPNTEAVTTEETSNDVTTTSPENEKTTYGIYDYKNIYNSRKRLLNDLNNVPTEILRETYFKNRERQLRKSRFEERDINSHKTKLKDNDEVRRVIEEEKKAIINKTSLHLWDLESEKELRDKKSGFLRMRRSNNEDFYGVPKLTYIGTLTDSINSTVNSLDLILVTYWLPSKNDVQVLLKKDIECIENKMKEALSKDKMFDKEAFREEFENECFQQHILNTEKPNGNTVNKKIPYYNEINQLRMGQLTIYRIQMECKCVLLKKTDKCAKILPYSEQKWSTYFGKLGDGIFETRN